MGGGKYVVFDALTKFLVESDDIIKDKFNLLIGNQEDTKNFSITDEDFLKILQSKGLIPEFGTGDGDTITDIQFDSSTSELTITTDKGSFSINLQQNYKVLNKTERDALIISVGETNLIGSQVYVSNSDSVLDPTTYRYDGVSVTPNWFEFENNPSSASPVLTKDITNNLGEALGGIEDQETLLTGLTYTDFVEKLITNIFYPTFTNPTFSLSKSVDTLQKIGATVGFNLTFNYNRGTINGALSSGIWNPSLSQNPRAGAATLYTIDGTVQGTTVLAVNKTIVKGYQSYAATVAYNIGDQPTDSTGANYSTAYPSGVSSSQTTTIEGVYPLFATTSVIATATEQSLLSMETANNIEKTLVAEVGSNKQFFDIPTTWLSSRAITSIQFYNTVSGSFDTTNQLATFTQTGITHTIESVVVNYTRFTNNTSNRGETIIKIIF